MNNPMQNPLATRMMAGKPLVSRRRKAMQEAAMPPVTPTGGRKPRKPAGNPMMGSGKPKRGMY